MKILSKPGAFVWDKGNIEKNFKKHNVTTQEAEELFSNEPFIIVEDRKHSTETEERYQALGETKEKRRLFVAFTVRNAMIRVISVRDMSKKEEVEYETIKKNS